MSFSYTLNEFGNDMSQVGQAIQKGDYQGAFNKLNHSLDGKFARQATKKVLQYVVDKQMKGELPLTENEQLKYVHLRTLAPHGYIGGEINNPTGAGGGLMLMLKLKVNLDIPWTAKKVATLAAKDTIEWAKNNPGKAVALAATAWWAPVATAVGGLAYSFYKAFD